MCQLTGAHRQILPKAQHDYIYYRSTSDLVVVVVYMWLCNQS